MDSPDRKRRTRPRDMKPLTDGQRELALKYLPLALSLARRLQEQIPRWNDEFESAACMALVQAARSFDPGRSIKFATYARFRIRGALVKAFRGMVASGFELDPYAAPRIGSLTPESEEHGRVLLAEPDPPVGADLDDVDAVEHLLRKLPRRHAAVCRMQYVSGKTQREIASLLGCSQPEIARLHMQSLEFLSEPYDSDGNVNRAAWRHRPGRKPRSGRAIAE